MYSMDHLEIEFNIMDDGRLYCRAEIDLTTLEWSEIEPRVVKTFCEAFNEKIKPIRHPDDLVSAFVDRVHDHVILNGEFIPRDFYEKWIQEDPNKRPIIFMIRVPGCIVLNIQHIKI